MILAVVLLFAANLLAQKKAAVPEQRIRAAAEFSERFLERYNETLDLAAIWDEFFAPNTIELNRKIHSDFALCMYAPRLSDEVVRELDDATLRRRLIAEANETYVRGMFMFTQVDVIAQQSKPALPEPYRIARSGMKYFGRAPESDFSKVPKLTTRAEVEQYIEEANKLASILRAAMPPGWQNSPLFKKNWAFIQGELRQGVIEHGDEPGIAEYYYIPRAPFWISVLHDGESYRIFHLSDLYD